MNARLAVSCAVASSTIFDAFRSSEEYGVYIEDNVWDIN